MATRKKKAAYGPGNLYSLTEEHRARLPEWRDLWLARILRTEAQTDDDRVRCTAAIDGLYRAAKLEPSRVIYVPSPIVGVAAWCFASMIWWLRENPGRHGELCGRSLTERDYAEAVAAASARLAAAAHGVPLPRAATDAATDAATRAATDAATSAATDAATSAATSDATRAATSDATRAATDAATYAATRAATDAATDAATRAATDAATSAATYDATDAATSAATSAATDAATSAATSAATDAALTRLLLASLTHWARGWNGGNHWGPWASYLSFFRHVADMRLPECALWTAYEDAAIYGSHRYMHARFCLVADFPATIQRDAQHRPHGGAGPSIAWRDGWALYHWHGVRIPAEWIVRPESLTVEVALGQENVELRNAAVEILGWERILASVPHRVIATDDDPEIGTLISVDLPGAPDTRYVRARCGTGRNVHYRASQTARTPLEAAAESYGLRPEEYRPEVRT